MFRRTSLAVGCVLALALMAAAQERISGANYSLAQKFNREFVAQHAQEASVSPQWIGKTDVFWYTARTATGNRYWKVDATKSERTALFDHVALAAKLSEASKKPLDGETLRLDRPVLSEDSKKLTFAFSENRYEYDLTTNTLKSLGKAPSGGFGQMTPEQIERMRQQFGDERVNEIQRQMRGGGGGERNQDQQQDQQQQTQGAPPPAPAAGPQNYKNVSPDKKRFVYAFKYNLYLGEEGQPEEQAVQLTTDGEEEHSFANASGGRGNAGTETGGANATPKLETKTRANVTWSPDSKAFTISRTDGRGVKDLWLVNSVSSPRPALEKYPYPMPGEESIRKAELYVCDVEKKTVTRVPTKWKDERYYDTRWGKTWNELRFIRRDRLQRNLEICKLDVATNKCDCQLTEGFDAANLAFQTPRYIEETDDLIWWSERSGWGHFYLYGRDGKLKNAFTSGSWRASRIVDVDAKNGLVYFVGNAREPGENPYFTHLYRVKFDGTELTCLDPSVAVGGTILPGGFNQTSYLSPSRKYLVVNSTRIDAAPFATLRDDAGKVMMALEETDLTRLEATGWKQAETFTVKAADGVTDLYGNIWKPFDFDAKKKYPIITYVYPGPQQEGVNHRFAAYSSYMQLAQIGFIVIQVGHRGGSPERSKAYHSFGYYNLRDYGLVDKKAAIEALAARHSFIDIERVGIYGHSGGGFMSAAALLQKPYNEFFKVAVASAGNHDNNIYNDNWSEQYHGLKEVAVADEKKDANAAATSDANTRGTRRRPPAEEIELEFIDLLELFDRIDPDNEQSLEELKKRAAELKHKIDSLEKGTDPQKGGDVSRATTDATKAAVKMKFDIKVPTNAELAENLKGHLMLVHGEIDNNVHPANTMRLVDALIKANKRFDLLIIPGARHGFGVAQPYFTQKMWEFFAAHLLDDRQTGADIGTKESKRK
jgi:dipeptidyl-peptidase 4